MCVREVIKLCPFTALETEGAVIQGRGGVGELRE